MPGCPTGTHHHTGSCRHPTQTCTHTTQHQAHTLQGHTCPEDGIRAGPGRHGEAWAPMPPPAWGPLPAPGTAPPRPHRPEALQLAGCGFLGNAVTVAASTVSRASSVRQTRPRSPPGTWAAGGRPRDRHGEAGPAHQGPGSSRPWALTPPAPLRPAQAAQPTSPWQKVFPRSPLSWRQRKWLTAWWPS